MSNAGLLKTLTRGLAILDYIAGRPDGVSNSQIAEVFDVDPAVSYRMLQTLTHAQYVHKQGTLYRLSFRLFSLVRQSWASMLDLATPAVGALAEETGFTVSLSVLEGHSAYPIILKQGESPLIVNANLGKRVPLHASSLGKALWAHLPYEQQLQIMASAELSKLTPNTLVDEEELWQELAQVRASGLAFDREEYQLEIRCIAAPVLDRSESVICALSVSYPAAYALSDDAFERNLAERIQCVARDLSNILGRAPSSMNSM